MKEFLEQLSTLGIRMLDAAASGKSKQLMQDTHGMAWKAIEMATDPATTLALAEVTAHLCHALEDAQKSLNPTPRKQRNKQNQSIYLNPYQMSEFPEQVTMEEVILSCLGRAEESKQDPSGDDAASLHSRLTLDEDFSTSEPEYRDWKERKEAVNVELLRKKIISEGLPKSGRKENDEGTADQRHCNEPAPVANQEKKSDGNDEDGADSESNEDKNSADRPSAQHEKQGDMEDINFSRVAGGRSWGLKEGEKRMQPSNDVPAVEQFYRRLDELLKEDRERLEKLRARQKVDGDDNDKDALGSHLKAWKARITKLKEDDHTARSAPVESKSVLFSRLSRYKILIIVVLIMGALSFTVFSGFACYGMYVLVKSYANPAMTLGSLRHAEGSFRNDEIIVRVVREVVHVAANGEIIGKSNPPALTQDQLDALGQKLATHL